MPRRSTRALGVLTTLLLSSGCRGLIEIPPQQNRVEIVTPGAAGAPTVASAGETTELIEPPAPEEWCFARARHFNGLVQRKCADIARETRP